MLFVTINSLTGDTVNTSKTTEVTNGEAQQEVYETLGGFIGPRQKREDFVKKAVDKMFSQSDGGDQTITETDAAGDDVTVHYTSTQPSNIGKNGKYRLSEW